MEMIFVVFPYIKTYEPIDIYGITFYSNKDLSSIPTEFHDDINTLANMFFLRDNYKLTDMVIALSKVENKEEKQEFIDRLIKAHTIITFRYSSPHQTRLEPFINKEHTDFYIFTHKKITKYLILCDQYVEFVGESEYPSENDRQEFDGFEGLLNNESPLWVTKGSHIYPTQPHLTLRYTQSLCSDFGFSEGALGDLCNKIIKLPQRQKDVITRIFTSIKWYNRSLSWTATDDIALVNMAIALEALVGLKPDKGVSERFKESIKLLTGSVNNLDEWLNQFYKVRSELVHDGNSDNLMFYTEVNQNKKEYKSKYRSMVSYSRVVFFICINSIVAGLEMVQSFALDNLLMTNKSRFEAICRIIDSSEIIEQKNIPIKQYVDDIAEYRFISEEGLNLDLFLQSLRRFCEYIDDNGINIPDGIKDEFNNLKVPFKKEMSTYYGKLKSVQTMAEFYKNNANNSEIEDIVESLLKLNESIWFYSFMKYFQLDNYFKQDMAFEKRGNEG
jgi:hypothetical protein